MESENRLALVVLLVIIALCIILASVFRPKDINYPLHVHYGDGTEADLEVRVHYE